MEGRRLAEHIAADRPDGGRQRDPRVRRGSEYDAFYQTLELPPGTPLADIETAGLLVQTAFRPDGASDHLRPQAAARVAAAALAVEELGYFWRTYGEAPPSADLGKAGGLLDALVEALGESAAAMAQPPTANTMVIPSPVPPATQDRRGYPDAARDGYGAEAAYRPIRLPSRQFRPIRRLHHIELAAVLVSSDVLRSDALPAGQIVAVPRPQIMLPASRPHAVLPAPRPQAALLAPRPQAALPAPRAAASPARIFLPTAPPLPRVAAPGLRAIALRAGVGALALAFGFLLQYYALGPNFFTASALQPAANPVSSSR